MNEITITRYDDGVAVLRATRAEIGKPIEHEHASLICQKKKMSDINTS